MNQSQNPQIDNNNRFYKSNPNLKAAGYIYPYTANEIDEWIKCSQDPIYFIKTYIKVVSLDKGFVPFQLYPFQEDMIDIIHNNRKTIGMVGRQSGKCVCINTIITVKHKDYNSGQPFKCTAGEFEQWIKFKTNFEQWYKNMPTV